MKTLVFLVLGCVASASAQTIPSEKIQVSTAVLAAPQELREGCSVYGYNEKGELTLLRKGSNGMICLADDPRQAGFNVSCYHEDLEPFMARGRELKKEGKNHQQVFDIREEEVKASKLKMPDKPSTLYVYTTSDDKYNRETGEITDGYLRYVIYIPYATVETTGLPLKPDAPGMPWLMDPGTHRAHIMINPPMKEN